MKKIITSGLLIYILTVLSSCEKAKVDISFNLDAANIYFVIEQNTTQGNLTFATTSFTSDLQAKLDENNASIDDVESIELTAASFKMINPGSQNFDIVDKANAYLSASGIAEIKVAYKDPVPDGVTQFSLDVESVNLKDYLKQSTVTFRASGFTNAPNVERDSLQAMLTFKIKAKVKP